MSFKIKIKTNNHRLMIMSFRHLNDLIFVGDDSSSASFLGSGTPPAHARTLVPGVPVEPMVAQH